jgi:IMP dehydrogenase
MNELVTFDDVLIKPRFSELTSRQDVDLSTIFGEHTKLDLPVISANMDTVTNSKVAIELAKVGATACLPRFMSIENNVKLFNESRYQHRIPMVSVGLGEHELDRAYALFSAGATVIVIDVAHGAQISVVKQVAKISNIVGNNADIVVGNFASAESIDDFKFMLNKNTVAAWKIGIGPGSACTTRVKTGVGVPQLSAIQECVAAKNTVIADGGLKTPGDIAKALGAGASAVMIGGMLAGTDETPGDFHKTNNDDTLYKKYRGSASKESYDDQGKTAKWRTAEGDSFLVKAKGPVGDILQDIEGGLRSSFTYVGAKNLKDFQAKVRFVRISGSSIKENGAHGKGT